MNKKLMCGKVVTLKDIVNVCTGLHQSHSHCQFIRCLGVYVSGMRLYVI